MQPRGTVESDFFPVSIPGPSSLMNPHKPCEKLSVNDCQFQSQGVERLKTIPLIRKTVNKVSQ